MTALLIDTSSPNAFIALAQEGELLALKCLNGDSQLSRNFLPSIQDLMRSCELGFKELNYVAIGIGPGSYTGTRVAATVGKTLSFAVNIPLIGFYSPLAFLPFEEGCFAALLETKKGDSFLLKGKKKQGKLVAPFTHGYFSPAALATQLLDVTHIFSDSSIEDSRYVKSALELPSLAAYTYERWQKGEHDAQDLELLYFNALT